jgi:hypothetical protein
MLEKPLAHPAGCDYVNFAGLIRSTPDFLSRLFAGSMGRPKLGARMNRTGQSESSRLTPQAMSLDEARQVIACWLESIQTVDPIDLTEERFDAAIASDIIAASAVEQFSAHVLHGRLKLARRLPMSIHFI